MLENDFKVFFGISTHTPLARRDRRGVEVIPITIISTHTPLARRDADQLDVAQGEAISTHTPLARRDVLRFKISV